MRRFFSTNYSELGFNFTTLLLRVTFSLFMIINHGLPKLMNFPTKVQTFFDPFHIGSQWSLVLVVFAEVFCSILLLLGLFTRLVLLPLITTMIVALFMVNWGKGWDATESAALYLSVYLLLLFVGPGKYSADAAMGK